MRCRVTPTGAQGHSLSPKRLLGDRVAVVPVDQRCLDRAAQISREQPVRLADAIHLAAADRLPRPISFVTFDSAQIPVALSLGFDVVSA